MDIVFVNKETFMNETTFCEWWCHSQKKWEMKKRSSLKIRTKKHKFILKVWYFEKEISQTCPSLMRESRNQFLRFNFDTETFLAISSLHWLDIL